MVRKQKQDVKTDKEGTWNSRFILGNVGPQKKNVKVILNETHVMALRLPRCLDWFFSVSARKWGAFPYLQML